MLSESITIAISHSDEMYYNLLAIKNHSLEDLIKRDINRTIIKTKNEKIRLNLETKKDKLFNILKAYAEYDQEVGYCQGTNFIVAVLLTNINSERASFWIFVQMMNQKSWRNLFLENTPKLIRMLDLLSNLIKTKLKELHEYFEKIDVTLFKVLKIFFISLWIIIQQFFLNIF